jgi:hypothetical protein
MTRVIGGEEMLTLLQQAVSERGDGWVYPDTNTCKYYYDPNDVLDVTNVALKAEFGYVAQPSCAVGLALSYITEMDIIKYILDTKNNGAQCVHLLRDINDQRGEIEFTNAAIAVAESMQISQDEGICWGDSLIKAKEMLAEWQSIYPAGTRD